MKKALKIAVVLGVVVLGIFVLSSTALHFLLPPEKAKALILKQLTGRLQREVTVGKVSVGLLSGLSVSDLKVSEAPDFSKGTFMSSDRFAIRLALMPLLARRVEVKQLTLDHPMINVVRLADGKTFNFSDLMQPTTGPVPAQAISWNPFSIPEAHAAPATPAPAEEAPFRLLISHAVIQNGVVRFLDRSPAGQSVDIDALDLKLRNVSMKEPFSVQTSFRAKARNIAADFKLAGEANLEIGSFNIKSCDLSSGGSSLSLSGRASRLKSNQPSVDLQLQLKEFKWSTLAAFAALPKDIKVEGPIGGIASVKGDQKKMNFSLALDAEKARVDYAKRFSKPAKVPMNLSLRGAVSELKNMDLAELKMIVAALQLKGHGKILGLTDTQPQLNLHIETNSFPVMDVAAMTGTALPQGLTLKGPAQISADISGTQASSHLAIKCDARDLDVSFGDKFAKPAGVPLRLAVVGEVIQPRPTVASGKTPAAKKPAASSVQVMNFQTLTLVLGALELNGNGSLRTETPLPRFQLALKSNTFSLGEFSKRVPLLASYKPGGDAVVDVRASGSSAAPQVNGSLTMQNGSVHYNQSDLSHIAAAMTFTRQDVSIPKLTAKLNGSDLTLKLTGRRMDTHPDIHVEASITEVEVEKLLASVRAAPASNTQQGRLSGWVPEAWAAPVGGEPHPGRAAAPPSPPMDVAGTLAVGRVKHEFYNAQNLDFKWDLKNITPDLAQVTGNALLKQGPGRLQDIEKLVTLSKTARIALLPITTLQKIDKKGLLKGIGLPSLDNIPFSGIRGDYVLRSGVMDIKAFDLTGEDVSVGTTGTIGLAGEQPLNIRVVMRLRPGLVRGTVGQFLSDETGRLTLAFDAKGSVPNPSVKLDVRQSAQKAVQQLGGQLLKGLGIGRPSPKEEQAPAAPNPPAADSPEPTPAPAPASAPAPDPAKDLEKALKNIFK